MFLSLVSGSLNPPSCQVIKKNVPTKTTPLIIKIAQEPVGTFSVLSLKIKLIMKYAMKLVTNNLIIFLNKILPFLDGRSEIFSNFTEVVV